jgi:hypothetical protein
MRSWKSAQLGRLGTQVGRSQGTFCSVSHASWHVQYMWRSRRLCLIRCEISTAYLRKHLDSSPYLPLTLGERMNLHHNRISDSYVHVG